MILPFLERPVTPRGYEVVGMTPQDIESTFTSLVQLSTSEALPRNNRFVACLLGYISYLSAENIPGCEDLLYIQGESIGGILSRVFEEVGANYELGVFVRTIYIGGNSYAFPIYRLYAFSPTWHITERISLGRNSPLKAFLIKYYAMLAELDRWNGLQIIARWCL